MSDFSAEQLEMIWEAVQYQIGSLEYIARRDPLWKLAPPGIAKYEQEFRERIGKLKQLASVIEQRLIELPDQGEAN
jgi:hypothetical protein